MKNINLKTFFWIFIPLSILIWFVILLFSGIQLGATWSAISKLPLVITIDLAIFALFVKLGWKLSFLQGWLVPYPVLEGSWKGEITTNWVNEEGSSPNPISVIVVIKQSFLHISCKMFTRESSSQSDVASFILEADSNKRMLAYTFTNTPIVGVRDRSGMHRGTALLDIIQKPERELIGEYWTNRNSVGSIRVEFFSNELLEKFPDSTP